MPTSSGSLSTQLRDPLRTYLKSKKRSLENDGEVEIDGLKLQGLLNGLTEINLVAMDLGEVIISSLGKAMVEVPCNSVTSLELGANSVTEIGIRLIAQAIEMGHLPALESLGLFPFRRSGDRARFINREEAQWMRNYIGDGGVGILAAAFRSGHASRLKVLTLEQNEISTEGAKHLADIIQRGHLPSLEKLNLSYNGVGDDGIKALVDAFEYDNNLKVLDLETCNIFVDGMKALATAFMSGKFPELTELYLGNNHHTRWKDTREGPTSDEGLMELARVLQIGQLPKLQILDLEPSKENISRRVAEALKHAVRSNRSLVMALKINWPPYSQYEGSVRKALEKNKRVARMVHQLKGEEDVPATNGKIFLCGHPEQGKTTLRKSLQRDASSMWIYMAQERNPKNEPRTRGIEVSYIVSKGERPDDRIQLAVWDLAGQSEYEVLHSAFLPDLAFADGQATTFVIVCDANYHGMHDGKHDGEQLLNHWMRFIASSSPKGDENCKRHVIVVLNCFRDEPFVSDSNWKRLLAKLKVTFQDYLEVEENPFVVDARLARSVKTLKEHLIQHTRTKLKTKRVPKICQFIQETITETIKTRKFPVVSWALFSGMFRSTVSEELKLKAAADYLHESGHIIIFRERFEDSTHNREASTSEGACPGRRLVVLDPDWFCRRVVGYLLLPDDESLRTRFHPDGSLALTDLKDYFHDLFLDEQDVSDIVAMLLRLGLCYQVRGDRLLIPALIRDDNLNPTGFWCNSGLDQWVMGYCLKAQYRTTTLLPIAIFRRLQVELTHDPMCAPADAVYATGKYNITFLTDGMSVLVEFSAHERDPTQEDRLDVLVRPLVSKENDKFADKRKELQVHVARLILERFISLAETWSPGVEFNRLVVKPWSTDEGIVGMEGRDVTFSVEKVKSRVQESGPEATMQWTVDREQVMAIDLLSGGELRELETSVADNCDMAERMIEPFGSQTEQPDDLGWNLDQPDFDTLSPEQALFLTSIRALFEKNFIMTKGYFDQRMDELMRSIQDVRKDLGQVLIRQRRVLNKLNALERFSIDEISKSVPRFMYLRKAKGASGVWMTVKDLVVDTATLHFLCEAHYNDSSLHEVENQDGLEIQNLTKVAAKVVPWLIWTLKVATAVAQVASQAALPGLGQLISALPTNQQNDVTVATSVGDLISAALLSVGDGEYFRKRTGIDRSFLERLGSPEQPVEVKEGLKDVFKELIGDLKPIEFHSKFKLRRVIMNRSGFIIWICDSCFQHYRAGGQVEEI